VCCFVGNAKSLNRLEVLTCVLGCDTLFFKDLSAFVFRVRQFKKDSA
jgi:hypothetical protein